MRGLRGVLAGACLWLVCGTLQASPARASADTGDQLFFIAHDMAMESPVAKTRRLWMYATVSPQAASNGDRRLHIRPLWTRSADAHGGGSLTLDPDQAEDRALLDVLDTGFELKLPRDDDGATLQPADADAWRTLARHLPQDDLLPVLRMQALGLRPVALPATLRVGQRIVRREDRGDFASVDTRMRVRALTEDVVLLDVEFAGRDLQGHGRQAVRRHDGRPLEARLYLTSEATGTLPTVTHRLHLLDMSIEPSVDLELDNGQPHTYIDVATEIMTNPPFSAHSDDPAHFALYPTAEGELESWMLPADALREIEGMLLFGLQVQNAANRPLIMIGTDNRANGRDALPPSRFASLKVHGVTLLDAARQPLPGADAVVVQPRLMVHDQLRLQENLVLFPFRLPVDLRAATLEALDTIQMQVDAETYRWDAAETVMRTAQPGHNPDAYIEWTAPHRVALVQPRPPVGQTQGQWTVAVPVDAAGREIPSAQVTIGRSLEPHGDWHALETMPMLRWEADHVPQRLEIATATPLAGLRLRHYTWQNLPRTWAFHDMRKRMTDAERADYGLYLRRDGAGDGQAPADGR